MLARWATFSQWRQKALELMLDNPEMKGFTDRGVRQLLRDFILANGACTARNETRPEWRDEDHPFWYKPIVPVPEFPKGLFVELTLIDMDEQDPWVEIVGAHPQRT